jgi:hypothetical protein
VGRVVFDAHTIHRDSLKEVLCARSHPDTPDSRWPGHRKSESKKVERPTSAPAYYIAVGGLITPAPPLKGAVVATRSLCEGRHIKIWRTYKVNRH